MFISINYDVTSNLLIIGSEVHKEQPITSEFTKVARQWTQRQRRSAYLIATGIRSFLCQKNSPCFDYFTFSPYSHSCPQHKYKSQYKRKKFNIHHEFTTQQIQPHPNLHILLSNSTLFSLFQYENELLAFLAAFVNKHVFEIIF